MLRYYYYINNGIDTDHIASVEESWIDNMLDRVAPHLRNGREDTIEKLRDEVSEEYLLSVKKAIVDFVLKDTKNPEEGDAADAVPAHREGLVGVRLRR